MPYRKNILSQPHNWLTKHYYIRNLEAISNHIGGRVLDVGCGVKPYSFVIEPYADEYIGLDCENATYGKSKVDVVGNAEILPFPDSSFDTVVSFQVIEHLPEPIAFFNEAFRVLKSGGKLITASPFQFGLHEEPRDYYRFTPYGLRYLAEKAGFDVISIEPSGGFWTIWTVRLNYFIRHYTPHRLRFIWNPFFYIDQVMADILDRIFVKYRKDCAGYTMLAEKR